MSKDELSSERILRAAADVLEREGALSMRRLAQELDVWPMAIYHYFRDKEALLDALAARAAGGVALPTGAESWREQLHALLRGARDAATGEVSSLTRAFLAPEGLRLSEAALAILQGAGLDERAAVRAWRALWSYTFGFAMFRVAPSPAEARRTVRAAIAALPDDDYPTLLAAVQEMSSALSDEDEFDHGLELLLDGIEAGNPTLPASSTARTAT